MRNKLLITILCLAFVSHAQENETETSWPQLPKIPVGAFPSGENTPHYFKIGGGYSPRAGTQYDYYPLGAQGNAGLGYSCGAFDPQLAIDNMLSDWESAFSNIPESVISSATAHMAALPSYILSRANREMYDMLNNNLWGAQDQLKIAIDSCESLEQQIAQGEDPYKDWQKVSTSYDWKALMSKGGDINEAKEEIDRTGGKNGLPWVGGSYAGGKGQPPVLVIHDTTLAGYNVLLKRDVTDTSKPAQTKENAHLTNYFAMPKDATTWAVSVLGDINVTTYSEGEKSSTPGVGLPPAIEAYTEILQERLQALVDGSIPVTADNLADVSAPGMLMNTQVLVTIRDLPESQQGIIIQKLAQEAATMFVLEQTLLVRRILNAGMQVPEIRQVQPAVREINRAQVALQREMDEIVYNMNIRRNMTGHTIFTMLEDRAVRMERYHDAPRFMDSERPVMDDGALWVEE